MKENDKNAVFSTDIQMLVAGILPNVKYFESRFDEFSRKQDEQREQLKEFKLVVDKKFEESRRDMLERFKQVDKRFEQVDKRFEQVDKRFEQVDKRFEQVDKRFEQVDKRFEQVDKRFEQVDKRFEQVDKRFEQIITSIDKLTDRFNVFIEVNYQQAEKRDEKQRRFTLYMFSIAITISVMGVLGTFLKVLGFI